MTTQPINLHDALGSFDALWSPRIVAQVNDYDVRVAKVGGEFVWHRHDDTDELFIVLAGDLDIALREEEGERVVHLTEGSVFTVPRGVEHQPSSSGGASILLLEPTGTVNTGDRTEDLPRGIRATSGEVLDL
jgi:mannose-6-phosphate isomerase-like protein (cupin superfamily)